MAQKPFLLSKKMRILQEDSLLVTEQKLAALHVNSRAVET